MLDELKSNFKFHPAFTVAILSLFTCVWSTYYLNAHFDIDIGWLLQCLDRFLMGGTYTNDFYETNPPLSFLIYLPAYPLYTFLGWGAHSAVFVTFMFYIGISNFVLYKLLIKGQYDVPNAVTITIAFIIVETWAARLSFASKDHLVFVFLPALFLLQYLITTDKKPARIISAFAIIMGAIAICLKPYYAIVPALFFLHRLFVTRSLSKCIISPDFLGLLCLGALYLGFVYIATPDYIYVLLPQITSIYNMDRPFPISIRFIYIIYATAALIISMFIPRDENSTGIKRVIYASALLSFICVIPYFIQMKGFHYHALPFLSFGMLALFLSIFSLTKSKFRQNDIAIWSACGLIAILNASGMTGGDNSTLTSRQFKAQPLVVAIEDFAWNGTYATYDFKSMLSALPYMTNLKNGSRFGQVWPIYGLSMMHDASSDDEKKKKIKQEMLKQVDMLAQDMGRYQPSVITIPQYRQPGSDEANRNYLNFLLSNDNFKKNMEEYVYEDSIPFDTTLTGTSTDPDKIVVHDVYILKQNHKLKK